MYSLVNQRSFLFSLSLVFQFLMYKIKYFFSKVSKSVIQKYLLFMHFLIFWHLWDLLYSSDWLLDVVIILP